MEHMEDVRTLSTFLRNQLAYRRLDSTQKESLHPSQIEPLEVIKARVENYIVNCEPLAIDQKMGELRGVLALQRTFKKILAKEELQYHGFKQKMHHAFYCATHNITNSHIDHCIKTSFKSLPAPLRESLQITLPIRQAINRWPQHSEEVSEFIHAIVAMLNSHIFEPPGLNYITPPGTKQHLPHGIQHNPFKYDLEEAFTEATEDTRNLPLSVKLHEHFFKIVETNYKPVEDAFHDDEMSDVVRQFEAFKSHRLHQHHYDYIEHDQASIQKAVDAYRINQNASVIAKEQKNYAEPNPPHRYLILRHRMPGPIYKPGIHDGETNYEKLTQMIHFIMTHPETITTLNRWEERNNSIDSSIPSTSGGLNGKGIQEGIAAMRLKPETKDPH